MCAREREREGEIERERERLRLREREKEFVCACVNVYLHEYIHMYPETSQTHMLPCYQCVCEREGGGGVKGGCV